MTETRTTFREVLAQPVFRLIFFGRAVAIATDTLRIVALSVLIFASTGSAVLAAVAFGIGFLPQAVGGVLLGALPDLVRPRILITTGYAAEAVAAATLALVPLPVWASLTILGAIACVTPVFHGSSGRLIAEVLTGDAYVVGRSLFQASSAVAQLAGLAAGGIAVAALGPQHALLVCAAAHLAVATATWLLLPDLPNPGRAGERALISRSLRGSRQLLADRTVRRMLLTFWLPPACVTGGEALLVPYAEIMRHPAGSAGFMLACVPAGMIVGDLVVARLLRPATRERLTVPLIGLLGMPLIGFFFDIEPALGGALLFLTGCGFAYSIGLQGRFLEAVPEDVRGQSFTLMSTGLMTLQGMGPLAFGGLAELIPIGSAIAAAGVATLGVALWLSLCDWSRPGAIAEVFPR
jgi:predicted MFS family arabinose efflux permease